MRGGDMIKEQSVDRQTRRMSTSEERSERYEALRHLMEAWDSALLAGISSEAIANAALFAALSDLIDTYGEEPVTRLAVNLPKRIQRGEFTLNRTAQ